MRKGILIGAILVAAVLVAGAAWLSLLDVNQFRGRVQAGIELQLGRPVTLGELGLRLIPLSLSAADVTIGESPAFPTGRPFAKAGEIRVRVALLPLLRKELAVQSFVLRQPAIELVRNKAGKWNFSELGGKSGGGSAGGGGGLSVAELRIEDGQVAVGDLGDPKSRSVYQHIDLALTDFGGSGPFGLSAALRLPGSGKGAVRFEGKGGPLGTTAPFRGRLDVQDAEISSLAGFVGGGSKSGLDATISAVADVDLAGSLLKARGGADLKNLRAGKTALERPVRLDFDLSDDLDAGLLKISSMKLTLGQVPVSLSGEINTKASAVNMGLKLAGAPLAEVLALARALGVADASGTGVISLDARARGSLKNMDAVALSGSGSVRDASIELPALAKPLQVRTADLRLDGNAAALDNLNVSLGSSNLRGNLTARNFQAPEVGFGLNVDKLDVAELQQLTKPQSPGGGQAASPPRLSAKGTLAVGTILYSGLALNNVRSECKFERGVLTLAPLTADLFGGKQTGGITVDTRTQPATVALNTKLEDVDADKLLSSTTSLKKTLYGLLAAGGDASVKLAGADMARTLNGNLNLRLLKGRLAGINIMNEVSAVGKFLGYAGRKEPYTDIVQLAGDVKIRDGVASTDNLQMQIEGGTVAAAGTVNLVDQALNLRLTAVLDRETSQKAGGNKIGGFLTTALANNKGELIVPALVTGSFAKPRFLPDGQRMAELKVKSLLPSTSQPGGGAAGLVQMLTGRRSAGSGEAGASKQETAAPEAGAAAKPSEATKPAGLRGILDVLRQKKEKPAEPKP